jgi:two-component system sensor histidine kinase MtrB
VEQPLDPRAELEERSRRFVALAAHELRAPATVVHGIAATLEERGAELGAEQLRVLHHMLHAKTTGLVRLMDQLLDLSRLDAGGAGGERTRVRVRERLLRVVDAVAGDRAGEVEVDVAPGLEACLDAEALDRVVSNLVTNALRHGGAPIRVSAEQPDNYFRLTVEDEGAGVPAAFQARLFDRFTRASPGEGAGLGLSIAQQYVVSQGGSLVYEDRSPHGARFRVVIPARPVEP